MVPITSGQSRRLLYAKHMLGRAAELQGKRSELLVSESLLLLHDASEMIMQVVYEHHNIKPPTEFMRFWDVVTQAGMPRPGFSSQMRSLNDLRVGFKHRGSIPNAATVRSLDAEVRAFCSAICSMYLDVQLEELSLADLIQNADVAKHLKAAESLFAEDKLEDALIELADALHYTWKWAEQTGSVFVYHSPIGGARMQGNAIATFEPGLIRYLNLALLRVDLSAYSQLCGLLPGVTRSLTNSKQVQWMRQPHATPEQFAAALSFLVEFAISVQGLSREPIL